MKKFEGKKAKFADVYQQVTDKMVAALEQFEKTGQVPWIKPWDSDETGMIRFRPINGKTKIPYRGINILLLWMTADDFGYTSNEWLTYQQAKDLGGHVLQGETSKVKIVQFKPWEKTVKNKETGEDEKQKRLYVNEKAMFNLQQTSLWVEPVAEEPRKPMDGKEAISAVVDWVKKTGADIRYNNAQAKKNRAYYSPAGDFIGMPNLAKFHSVEAFHATELHEIGHWSGAKHRLNRDFSGMFGSHAYMSEELVAEMFSAFACAALGIPGTLQHAAYVSSWINTLKEDKRIIVKAASAASKAFDYVNAIVTGKNEEIEPEENEDAFADYAEAA